MLRNHNGAEKTPVLGLAHYRTISHSFLKGTTQLLIY